MKKIFTFLLTLTMVITVGVMPFGEENKETISASAETYGDFEYTVLSDGTVEISKYNGSVTTLSIPSTIAGKKVTSIGAASFWGCSSFTSIKIPNTITNICYGAFAYCSNLISVTIPENVAIIENQVFCGCLSLKNIDVSSDNSKYSSLDGVLFDKSKTKLVQYPIANTRSNYIIPSSVTIIQDNAFELSQYLISIYIPNGVTDIGDRAFKNCVQVQKFHIPKSVLNIGYLAFIFCSDLYDLSVDSENKNYSSEGGVLFNKNKTKLIQYPIGSPNSTYTILDSVKQIEDRSFAFSSSLEKIIIPNSIQKIGDSAFAYCSNLKDTYYQGNISEWNSIKFGVLNDTVIDSTIHYNYDPNHTHNYTSSITKQPTCTATGVRTYTCSCGDSYTETIAKKAHTYSSSWTIDKAATCTAEGSKSHHCTVCGTKKDVTAIPKIAHNYNNGVVTKQPTETTTGIKTYTCTVCGGTKTETIPKLTHTHSYTSSITKQPTCTATGIRTYKCSCGDSYTETIAKKAHSYSSSWTIDKVATCTSTGSKSHHCTVCGAKKDVTAIPKTVHTYNNGVVTKQPTCTSTGVKTYTCSCGDSYTEKIKATGHKFGSWKTTKKATCKSTGTQTRKCSLCGKTETKTISKTAHSYKNVNVNSTYFTKGYTAKKCSACGTITGKKYKALLIMSSPKASSVSTTSLKLTWNKVKDAKGYDVYQNGKKIKTVSGTSYTVSKLKAGTSYKFTVKPYNSKKAYGNQSKVLKATTVKLGKISLNWKKTSGANGYQIQICPNNKFKSGVKSYTTTRTNLAISGLPKGKSYYVRLRAYKKSGSKYKYSVWSKVKKAVSR